MTRFPDFERFQSDGAVGMLGLQARNGFAGLGNLRELAGGLRLHLLHARFKPPRGHGDLGVKLAHVGFDLRHQLWRDCFEALHGAASETRPHEPSGAENKQEREENPDSDQEDRLTHTKPRGHPTRCPR
jgi:hypothetical protein